jgi:predicted glycosyl hydrolase (DUF1957 family)
VQTLGLVLCIVNTQPPGTSGDVIRRACERAYFPMLDLIEQQPSLRLAMHWSGQILEWIESSAAPRLEQLLALVKSGRVEVLAGLHGGAVLPALPERDAVGQVQLSQRWWRQRSEVRIRGAWLPHGAWDPVAPRVLGRLGIQYSVLDASQLGPGSTNEGYHLAEREG